MRIIVTPSEDNLIFGIKTRAGEKDVFVIGVVFYLG